MRELLSSSRFVRTGAGLVAVGVCAWVWMMGSAKAAEPAAAQTGTALHRGLYVSVVDKDGKPVASVAPEDLIVREDGVAREVLRVEPATDSMQVALLVDH